MFSFNSFLSYGIQKGKLFVNNYGVDLSNFKKITTDTKVIDINSNYELILGEVKSDSSSLDQAINQMKKYSEELDFEQAISCRDRIKRLEKEIEYRNDR